jgi:hypothetical protein
VLSFKNSEKENCNETNHDEPRAPDGASGWRRYFDDGSIVLLRSGEVLHWRLPLPLLQQVAEYEWEAQASHPICVHSRSFAA